MKIGLIIHSVTGNTLSVAKELQKRLTENGHEAVLEEIKTEGKVEFGAKDAKFLNMPDLKGYDLIIFGSHTEAFQLEITMKIYFEKIERIEGKAICFATHQFPLKWLGGTGTVNKMKTYCEEKGLKVIGTSVINWSPESKRQTNIDNAIKEIAGLI
jgi:flavodoxin